ncbi:kynurenine 3-monooxygenase [Acrodontium crateriforme]|uniref:Kynurenine 3-monooxygenase n=1 Tax=Acrodontium crateriforme TaxID=150365 RepID=A0AAQ3M2M1_9PEZI|nr:kynurenine 3-monooxygenase [Acrodontium crateriforme]
MAGTRHKTKCLVVGAGPVGALSALYAARRGWDVEVYELRGDLRNKSTTPLNFTKSINLALSERGIEAIRQSDSPKLLDLVLNSCIPMHGRMIHGQDGHGNLTEESQSYDNHGRYIRAVDRGALNKMLLDELETLPNVKLLFHHKLTGADFNRRKAWFEQKGVSRSSSPENHSFEGNPLKRAREIEVDFDLILGCDGAYSAARFHLMKFVHMDYEQSYIDTLWCEFRIDPSTSNSVKTPSARDGFATSPNHLHIWPSSDKMFIAIPSEDKSFTCTLFAPGATFKALENDPSQVELFFNVNFPGAADLLGSAGIQKQFESNPHLPLISIKCAPHHYGSTGVILGDAAHAMVPFYGQGMNAGLEDVRVVFSHLDANAATPEGRAAALEAYSKERVPDAHTINDLAFANYWEMHAGVRSPLYLLRKKIEEFLNDKVPSAGFATQYSRISFSTQRYSEVAAILVVLSSSRLSWTGEGNGFTLVGYSLGGGIAAAFTADFPRLVDSLVLLAPAGLIRPHHISATSRILYNDWLPKSIINRIVARRLRASNTGQHPAGGKSSVGSSETPPSSGDANAIAASEIPDHCAAAKNSNAVVFEDRPRIAIPDVVNWQTDSHPGFVESFISSIKYAPITNGHECWGMIGQRQEAQRSEGEREGLQDGRVLILLGKQDGVIIADETEADAIQALGEENLKIVKLEGGHDVPIVKPMACVDVMFDFWEEGGN